MGCSGRFWKALGASVRLCKALDAWGGYGKLQEFLGGMECFERLWEALKGFGRLWRKHGMSPYRVGGSIMLRLFFHVSKHVFSDMFIMMYPSVGETNIIFAIHP